MTAHAEQGELPIARYGKAGTNLVILILSATGPNNSISTCPGTTFGGAKAAYAATNGQEMDRTWSEFISRAILNEVARRERLYNAGEESKGGNRNLAPGRKITP